MHRNILVGIILLVGALCVAVSLLFSRVVTQDEGLVFYVPPGQSKSATVAELADKKIIAYPKLLHIYTLLRFRQIKTGEYLFPKGSTPFSIWQQLVSGRGLFYRSFTIVPGWSFSQLRRELLQTETLRHNTKSLDDKQIMLLLGSEKDNPEGEFFPETYLYTRDVPDLVILSRAYELMQSRLKEAWEKRLPGLPYKTPYEALIAASLIEKEAYLPEEKQLIASVLINRLRKNMILQFDPTVIYGLGDRYTGKLRKKDLLIDTPYNTYLHRGLTPTPIAMPSMGSIEAALHPAATDYLYFVAKGDGSHQFSKTLKDHNQAVTASKTKKTAYFNSSIVHRMLPFFRLATRII